MATDRPKARQSQLVTTYGVGSLFPAGEQSFMVAGIDEWDTGGPFEIEEPRLARSLEVDLFRAPPTGRRTGDVPVVRFPTYHYCPACRRLDRFWTFDARMMQCATCDTDLTPSRFVACCENGHIEDFPYFQWLHRGQSSAAGAHTMRLEARGASSSLADIVLSCDCGVPKVDLDGSFTAGALREVKKCGGRRPWLLGAEDQQCEKPLRVLQRGSSNVWFAAVRSSISIPPWSSPNAKFVTSQWPILQHLPESALEEALRSYASTVRIPGVTFEGMLAQVRLRKGFETTRVPSDADLRAEEYLALIEGHDGGSHDAFQCRRAEVAGELHGVVTQVSKATRLREVRALYGFSRVTPMPTDTVSPSLASLSKSRLNWLPATEVLGEGVFVRLDEDMVASWEASELAVERCAMLAESLRQRAYAADLPVPEPPSARFVAVHSLAHSLLQELSLDAGYPVGSLRERVYAAPGQAGFLVYTASSDAAGSLGGLAALAEADTFSRALEAAVSRAGWCSNDPVCGESGPSGADGLNLAACHACLLLPETSCEHRNVFLDRVMLTGRPNAPEGGLLSPLIV